MKSPQGDHSWGISSAGRAPGSHPGGQRFDSAMLHHSSLLCAPRLTRDLASCQCAMPRAASSGSAGLRHRPAPASVSATHGVYSSPDRHAWGLGPGWEAQRTWQARSSSPTTTPTSAPTAASSSSSRCNRCGNGYRTEFDSFELATATNVLRGRRQPARRLLQPGRRRGGEGQVGGLGEGQRQGVQQGRRGDPPQVHPVPALQRLGVPRAVLEREEGPLQAVRPRPRRGDGGGAGRQVGGRGVGARQDERGGQAPHREGLARGHRAPRAPRAGRPRRPTPSSARSAARTSRPASTARSAAPSCSRRPSSAPSVARKPAE